MMEEAETVTNPDNKRKSNAVQKLRKAWPTIARIALLSLVVVAVIGVAGTVTGWVAVVVKNPGARVAVIPNICGETVINKYNVAMDRYYQGYPDAVDTIGTIVNDFSKTSGYEGDPNCGYIKFRLALFKSDLSSAQTQIDIITKLSAQSKYMDPRLDGIVSVSALQSTLASMKSTTTARPDD